MPGYTYQPRGVEMHACNCIGPQNGDPVCPCRMPEYTRRQMGERALDLLIQKSRTQGNVGQPRQVTPKPGDTKPRYRFPGKSQKV